MTMRVAVAASGRGSNLEALLRALGKDAPARVVLVLSNRGDAGALGGARAARDDTELMADQSDGEEMIE
ncbi:MAG: phosphoribosylglycinamide formyltransferase, partial [Gemmatimonadales bacterium]